MIGKYDSSLLVIDDDQVVRQVTAEILSDKGYQVHQAGGLDEAWNRVAQKDYALVITDLQIPAGNGIKIINTLKQVRPLIDVVVMTGYATLDAAIESMRAGAVDFIMKPYSPGELCSVVEKIIEKRELSRENKLLKILNEMKDKFLNLVSHELRTPLTLIYGYLVILNRQSASLTEDQNQLLEIITKSTKQLISLCNNIQVINQAEAGEIKLHLKPISILKLLSDVLSEIKASTTERKVNMRLEAAEEIEPLNVDSLRLRQSLMEIMQNALRNTRDGGEIIIGARRQNNYVVIWIKDNGIGIPVEELGRIFETFYEIGDVQHHSSSTSAFKGGGIGIGLPLVKAVVEAHKGFIRLDSKPGHGTSVEISIPANLPADRYKL
ncbi:response regulator [bacterium]|nr:response regulator [bacterium]